MLLPTNDGSRQTSSASSCGSTDHVVVPEMATGTVVGSLPTEPGGFEIRTQVPSEFIITGG